jgi:hypothetical protein
MMAMFMHKFENFVQAKQGDLGDEAAVTSRSPSQALTGWTALQVVRIPLKHHST